MYEIVSDMSSRQDTLEERLTSLEDKLAAIQEQVDCLPDVLTRFVLFNFKRLGMSIFIMIKTDRINKVKILADAGS